MPKPVYLQGRYWICTIPFDDYPAPQVLPEGVQWIKGQAEIGEGTGFKHWQLCVSFSKKVRLSALKAVFGVTCHAELTRSEAAETYVHKEETRVPDTQFEFGVKCNDYDSE